MFVKYNFLGKFVIGTFFALFTLVMVCPISGSDIKEFEQIDPNVVPDELVKLADITQANYEKIKTLQGETNVEYLILYRGSLAADILKKYAGITKEPNEIADKSECVSTYNIDLEKDLLFFYTDWPKPSEYIDVDDNAIYTSSMQGIGKTKIVASDYEIESRIYRRKKDGTVLSRKAEKQKRRFPQMVTGDFDPRGCFNVEGKPVWLFLNELSEGLRKYQQGITEGYFGVILEKAVQDESVIYRVQLTIPGASKPYKIFILDGTKGFNPTYLEIINIDEDITISGTATDYTDFEGIYLPTKRSFNQYDRKEGYLKAVTNSNFKNIKVNTALPENAFGIDKLGLVNGDKFLDTIKGMEYVFQDANFVPVDEVNQ